MNPSPKKDEVTDALISVAWALVTALKDRGYTRLEIKKALSGRMVDAYLAVEENRKVKS